ncbi:unnamed protein product [Orchesella dallaii]|uniref:Guanylate-binding protein N-terminal domain-containing protein n=1 Tax=Orchesella dallaii TaxID=48710 RepID=A0ABP1RTH8_9HEXA
MAKLKSLPIVRRVNGELVLDLKNFDKILEIINLNSDIPLAIISFVGKRGCGKTFYTNLLIQNLQNNSTGGWLNQVNYNSGNDCHQLPGFPYDKKDSNVSNQTDSGEIRLWAEAFPVKNHGKKFAILIFHLDFHLSQSQSRKGKKLIDSLELFLTLVSSRSVEIQWQTTEFRLLEIYHHILEENKLLFENILAKNSMVYLFRTNQKPSKLPIVVGGTEAVVHFRKMVKKTKSQEVSKVEECHPNVSIAYVDDGKKNLQNSNGSLSLSTIMYRNLEAVINFIADDEEIFPKSLSKTGEELTVGKLKEFMQFCANVANEINEKQTKEKDESQVQSGIHNVNTNTNIPAVVEECQTTDTENTIVNCKTDEKITALKSELSKDKNQPEENKQMNELSHEKPAKSIKEEPTSEESVNLHQKNADAATKDLYIVDFVVKQVQETILKQLKNWEQADGTPITTTLPDLLKSFEEKLTTVLHYIFEKAQGLKEQHRQWLITSSKNNLNEFHQELSTIQNLLQSFQGLITTMATENGYIVPDEFPKLQENMKMQGKSKLKHDISLEYLMRGCNWLISRYRNENQYFFCSLEIISIGVEIIRKFYVEETKRILKDGPYSSITLLNIHFHIISRCITAFISVAELPLDTERLIKFAMPKINKQLSVLKQSNRKMLQLLQKRVTNLIAKAKANYDQNEALNNFLNKKKMTRKEIVVVQGLHEKARAEAVLFLEERITRGEIRNEEKVAGHRMTLLAIIDDYWKGLLPQYVN